jgi:hypothetical protein
MLLSRKAKAEAMYGLIVFGVLGMILLTGFYMIFYSSKEYLYYQSPTKSNTIIVENDTFLTGQRCSFYERKAGIFIRGLRSQGGFNPFSDNNYNGEWIDDKTVIFQYSTGDDNSKHEKVFVIE